MERVRGLMAVIFLLLSFPFLYIAVLFDENFVCGVLLDAMSRTKNPTQDSGKE